MTLTPKSGHIPQRMCVICRRRFAKPQLSRYVFANDGTMQADEHKIMDGRGYYCCAGTECQKKLAKFKPGAGKRRQGVI